MTELNTKYRAILGKVPSVAPDPYDALPVGNLGICGAHRTGKTTLAKALYKELNIVFIEIGTSQIFAENNLDPARPMDFRTRLWIQQKILSHAYTTWFEMDVPFVCDRTPIDMAAYTLAEVHGDTLDDRTETEFLKYLSDCKETTERFFSHLILVPPAIPIVPAIGKASASRGYIEHIHTLVTGLWNDSNVDGAFRISKDVLDLGDRINEVKEYLNVSAIR